MAQWLKDHKQRSSADDPTKDTNKYEDFDEKKKQNNELMKGEMGEKDLENAADDDDEIITLSPTEDDTVDSEEIPTSTKLSDTVSLKTKTKSMKSRFDDLEEYGEAKMVDASQDSFVAEKIDEKKSLFANDPDATVGDQSIQQLSIKMDDKPSDSNNPINDIDDAIESESDMERKKEDRMIEKDPPLSNTINERIVKNEQSSDIDIVHSKNIPPRSRFSSSHLKRSRNSKKKIKNNFRLKGENMIVDNSENIKDDRQLKSTTTDDPDTVSATVIVENNPMLVGTLESIEQIDRVRQAIEEDDSRQQSINTSKNDTLLQYSSEKSQSIAQHIRSDSNAKKYHMKVKRSRNTRSSKTMGQKVELVKKVESLDDKESTTTNRLMNRRSAGRSRQTNELLKKRQKISKLSSKIDGGDHDDWQTTKAT
ncbi:unnamed protein product [Toxocara canis]|uniref:Uncharacterized protein n=1 Tax=Toxocara canis TaxID=6265 RepID=A0A183V1C9_TOXCA|nr:unnamed protein product [Toxocara canis]